MRVNKEIGTKVLLCECLVAYCELLQLELFLFANISLIHALVSSDRVDTISWYQSKVTYLDKGALLTLRDDRKEDQCSRNAGGWGRHPSQSHAHQAPTTCGKLISHSSTDVCERCCYNWFTSLVLHNWYG